MGLQPGVPKDPNSILDPLPVTDSDITSGAQKTQIVDATDTNLGTTINPLIVSQNPTLPTYTTPPDSVAVDTSTSGDNVVVAAPGAGKTIYVYAWNLSFNGSINAKFTSGAAGTNKSGTIYGVANSGGGNSVPPPGYLFKCAVDTELVLNLSAAIAVGGSVSYFVI